ncbi:thiol:disulfide interchange protein DsbA/DsbL [Thiohalobacter sp. IOR34]|uniref:thiol:disulfide interchange protein DsbA/DsbL n=1 Tax=Thiohalobacter sp. IOR34 TaxID=3057176 RepID=UPI0025AF51A0|nr:thiol:disulfide interchange protein DsbA/DsbL [Thiohalobacter sp. IOR34]WJW75461.1 thiol:disulfide interchange protein DsbA/DsbL [Thiohalobacter sp. IOR34]
MRRKIISWLMPLLAALFMAGAASAAGFDEGIEYKRISPPLPTRDPAKIEVVEMFWYGCPHCYQLEPELADWLKRQPADVEFVRVPAVLAKNWEPLARAWYTAELLGVEDRIHAPLFRAIHQERRRFRSADDLRKFFVEQGVSGKDFDATYNSFGVLTKINRARQLTRRSGIRGVPSLIVNGKYRTSASDAGSHEAMLRVVDYLIERERQARQAAARP